VRDEPARGNETGSSRVRTVFVGSGSFGVPSLSRLAAHPAIALVGIVTAPPRPSGRHQELTPTPIATVAGDLGFETVLEPPRIRAADSIAGILALEPSMAVLADYGQIVPPPILELAKGALNLHPSLLPRHRGATPIPAAILAGDARTGVTIIRMDRGIDTGPIVAQEAIALDGSETTPELEARLASLAAELLERTIGRWLVGDLDPRSQDEAAATLTRSLRREDGRLRASRPASELERQVRAYAPWPGSFIETPQGRLIVHTARIDGASTGPPGTIDAIGLNTVDGRLAFGRVQPAGGRVMDWSEYLRGGPNVVGGSIVE
jgi:methionyl-tRNA formyltransferase